MKKSDHIEDTRKAKQRIITERIDASIELSHKLGKHPLTQGCNCIVCANRRKRLLKGPDREWKYRL